MHQNFPKQNELKFVRYVFEFKRKFWLKIESFKHSLNNPTFINKIPLILTVATIANFHDFFFALTKELKRHYRKQ